MHPFRYWLVRTGMLSCMLVFKRMVEFLPLVFWHVCTSSSSSSVATVSFCLYICGICVYRQYMSDYLILMVQLSWDCGFSTNCSLNVLSKNRQAVKIISEEISRVWRSQFILSRVLISCKFQVFPKYRL